VVNSHLLYLLSYRGIYIHIISDHNSPVKGQKSTNNLQQKDKPLKPELKQAWAINMSWKIREFLQYREPELIKSRRLLPGFLTVFQQQVRAVIKGKKVHNAFCR